MTRKAVEVGMFRLRVLGGFALERSSGVAAPPLPRRGAEAVLAVLAVCGDLGCTRERLATLLWCESDAARSRRNLRDALHAIRHTLAPEAVPAGGHVLRLDPGVVVSDVRAFLQELASGRLADAVQMYAGPLLDGFHLTGAPEFERWLDAERARLARANGEALERLASAAERAGDWHAAAAWWGRAVEHDSLNSHVVVRHAHALAAIGDRANAIQVADRHVRRLRRELDLEPDRVVVDEIERIRRGQVVALPGAGPLSTNEGAEDGARTADGPPISRFAETTPADSSRIVAVGRMPRWVRWTVGVAGVVLLAAAFRGDAWPERYRPGAGRSRTAIAVLPFENLGADPAGAYLAGGLHDELLTRLARVATVKVVGTTPVGPFRGTATSLRQIGEELRVGSIVEASVQVAGDQLHVIVQLIDPASGAELWTASYDRAWDDAVTVERAIAQDIVTAIGVRLHWGATPGSHVLAKHVVPGGR